MTESGSILEDYNANLREEEKGLEKRERSKRHVKLASERKRRDSDKAVVLE